MLLFLISNYAGVQFVFGFGVFAEGVPPLLDFLYFPLLEFLELSLELAELLLLFLHAELLLFQFGAHLCHLLLGFQALHLLQFYGVLQLRGLILFLSQSTEQPLIKLLD